MATTGVTHTKSITHTPFFLGAKLLRKSEVTLFSPSYSPVERLGSLGRGRVEEEGVVVLTDLVTVAGRSITQQSLAWLQD